MNSRMPLQMVVVGVVASVIGITLGIAIDWFPAQASTQAGPIDRLWDVLIVASVPFFVLVCVVVLFAAKNFRMRPGQENQDGPPIHGNTKLEVVWTTLPAILLIGLCSYAYIVLRDIERKPANAAQELRVKVIGEQFTWTFEYPGVNGAKPVKTSQLYLPKGRSVKFDIVSKDVLHDFWIPAMRMKIDAVPGITTTFRVTPTRLGRYPVVCAELCGLGHAFMRQTAHVLPEAAFTSWLEKKRAPTPVEDAAGGGAATAAIDAKKLFTQGNGASSGCAACHKLADAGATGAIGPNLDEALKSDDAAKIMESIVEPDKEVAEPFGKGLMPSNYGEVLSPEELKALVKYLDEVTQ